MKRLMGLINLDHEHHLFNELTYFRNSASIPFAGRYRLIDFTLSNIVNTGIEEVAIFVRNKYRSLLDHLGTGENWDLNRRNGGLFILPPDWHDPSDKSKGDLQFFHNNRDYFHRSNAEYVLISGSQFITNTDYKEAFQFHLDRGADVTLISTQVEKLLPEHERFFKVEADDLGWVKNITNDKHNPLIFTGVYIINKELLMKLVDECIAYHKDHFFVHGVAEKINQLKIQNYRYRGYSAFINSIESYYRQNMKLLCLEDYEKLFYQKHLVRTKISNNPSVQYKKHAQVNRSILANGCVINGKIEGSILFRGVEVHKGSSIKNSIIMQRCTIEEDVYLENVILDKDVQITKGQRLIGSPDKPFVVAKRQVI
ncbi:glucose-1-phosphate adenylyltransferase subunit GlgD [Pallidibacillus thermolactis]|jgi:glucose-1-phosphate adenylyltransferase|uniref:glucose-1-phosphate adenylyltransferase subunit GlgD n=1 Tax=Pallidibacillus thermolactis TaxID=251051 RepID=UPI0021D9E906|nr:glucose-1-phosphate adenylyltransferase subunit GlgD [Pallidibacillus thermolactis]MCU9600680.1 glucose-1-phosphate adenylyltransferase subunit GlgD [Pallidibacillus thermolactis subsp. kokeshiiformis]MED1674672.1 glucose-1-phosphate adenylyltransferase subunit GlgD [Pallidibacillus thermolactis subsp. kokeshiiformis]